LLSEDWIIGFKVIPLYFRVDLLCTGEMRELRFEPSSLLNVSYFLHCDVFRELLADVVQVLVEQDEA
jgi:hypothetical protein